MGIGDVCWPWAESEVDQCVAVCFMRDEHWGRVGQRCELEADHDVKYHATGMRACEPEAILTWPAG